jgi:putative oxidoreductase
MDKIIPVAARVLLAQIFLIVGVNKVVFSMQHPEFYDQFLAHLGSIGLPPIVAPLMILIEIGAGATLLLGWKTRISAWILAVYSLFIAFALHQADGLLLQYLAIVGGMLAIIAYGPGPCSLDNLKKTSAPD